MVICLTGAAGFIGSHIADELIEAGHTVVGLDDLSAGKLSNVHKQEAFFQLDLSEAEILFQRYEFDLVIHCAAQTNVRVSIEEPIYDAMENIFGSLSLLEAMRKWDVKNIIFISTGGAIYDANSKRPISESSPPKPLSPYGIAKYSIENYLRYYEVVHSFKPAILRLANVYGARATKGIINICINKFKADEKVDIFGGFQTRDYIHVSDVVSAIQTVIDNNLEGVFNVGTGIETSLVNLVTTIVGDNKKWALLLNKQPAIQGELDYSSLDSRRLQKWGWKHKISLQEGIKLLRNA